MTDHAVQAVQHLDPVGRDAELARLGAWLGEVAGGTRALVLRGDQGIGRTTLWRWASLTWRATGAPVLLARPAEEERHLAMSGIVDLFEHAGVDLVALLASDDPIRRGRIVLQALREVTADSPVLVAVDDLQWLDAASARALRYALRRLDTEPLGIIATAPSESDEDPLPLANLLPPGRVEVLDVGPLDLVALRRLVAGVVTTISPRTLRRIFEGSGGNPMFALEMTRDLLRRDTSGRPHGGLAPPSSLHAAMVRRLTKAPAAVAPILEAVSALGRVPLGDLVGIVPSGDVEALLTVAEEHGLLTLSEDLVVRFSHPAMGAAFYERLRPLHRRRLHARLAGRIADPDLRARHLALGTDEPDAAVAQRVADAAVRASAGGALSMAAELAEHGLRLTPPDDAASVRRRTLQLVRYLAAAGDQGRALEVADRLIACLAPGRGRAEALVERAQLEDADLDTGEALLVSALDDAGDDVALRGRVLDQLGWLRGVFRGDLSAGVACAREALGIAQAGDDREFEMSAAAGLSNMETLAGRPRPDLMARAVAIEDDIGRPPLWCGPRVLLGEQYLWAGRLVESRMIMEAAVAHAEASTHERWRPYSLYDLAAVESAGGNLVRADGLLRQAMEAARDCEDEHVESWVFYRVALVATWLGRSDDAREAAQRRVEAATAAGERTGLARARSVLGLLALSEGDTVSAAEQLTASVDLLDAMGFAHPGAIPALPDAIEAVALVGDDDTAMSLLARLGRQAAQLDSAWVHAALDRATGTVALAQGDDGAAVTLQRAGSAFAALGFLPDAARADLLRGRALLRRGRRTAAAQAFLEARDAFVAMHAVLWAARAGEQLERAAPGRASGQLTRAERRIATLVADGLRNAEIAQTLFVSAATVEAHLTRIYRKLDIRSRSQLTRLVADGSVIVTRLDPSGGRPT